MNRIPALFVGALLMVQAAPAPLLAQTPEEASVLRPVQELFDAMAAGDAQRAAAVLLPEGQWVAVRPGEDGDPVIAVMPHREFLDRLAESEQQWLERFWDPQIMIHGPIAVVWTPYDFYRDGTFSHCGMDAFTLVRDGERWRIAGATYTVEPEGCPPSPLGQP